MTTRADDPFDLNRFVVAQAGDYDQALAELRAGRKRSHWIWYILPQLQGLGHSQMSQRYAIDSLADALNKYFQGQPDRTTLSLLVGGDVMPGRS